MSFGYQILGFGGGSEVLTEVTFQDSNTSTGASIAVPASTIVGDVLILLQKSRNGTATAPTDVTPAGFTNIGTAILENIDARSTRFSAKFKIAVSGDASSSITGMDDVIDEKIIFLFKPNTPANTIVVNDFDGVVIATNPVAQTITSSGGTTPLIVIGVFGRSAGATTTQSFTPTQDGTRNSGGTDILYGFRKVFNSSPVNVIVDQDDEGTHNNLASFFLEVS